MGWRLILFGLLMAGVGFLIEMPASSPLHDSAPFTTVGGLCLGSGIVFFFLDLKDWLKYRDRS